MNTIIEKIRAEVERRIAELENDKYINLDAKVCRQSELKYIDRFLSTLQEQTVCEDLEMASERYATMHPACFKKVISEAFKAGAEWRNVKDGELMAIVYGDGIRIGMTKQKDQMMKEAVDVTFKSGTMRVNGVETPFEGGKAKLIIVKED